jgi:hypothetical protein
MNWYAYVIGQATMMGPDIIDLQPLWQPANHDTYFCRSQNNTEYPILQLLGYKQLANMKVHHCVCYSLELDSILSQFNQFVSLQTIALWSI